jgi:hypothetical protein
MVDIPIWRFGTRWVALQDYNFHPEDNRQIPLPDLQRRTEQGGDVALIALIPANLSVFVFLMLGLRPNVQKATFFQDLIGNPDNFSIICYLIFVIFYSTYLASYYRTIWSNYYSLFEDRSNDKIYFYLYAFSVAVFSIAAMFLNPLLWPAYVFVLFVALVFKKLKTMRLFCDAVHDYFTKVNVPADVFNVLNNRPHNLDWIPTWIRQLISARALTISFTRNFVVWGLGVYGLLAAVGLTIAFKEPVLTAGGLLGTHQIVSLMLIVLMVAFFILKTGGGGIRRLKNQIENGEWEGFSLLRRPWA